MLRAVWESICEWSFGPLSRQVGKEWRYLKKYPGIFGVAVCLAVAATWYAARYWYFSVPYTGPTGATLFFPGDGTQPTAIYKANLYRLSHFEASMQATLPRDGETVLMADARFWQVNLIFDKEVDAENSVLSATGLTPESHIEIKDFDRRSAFVAITPASAKIENLPFKPKGMLEIVVHKRTTNKP